MQHTDCLSEMYQIYQATAKATFASEVRCHGEYIWYFLKKQYCSLLVNHVNLTLSGGKSIENMHA